VPGDLPPATVPEAPAADNRLSAGACVALPRRRCCDGGRLPGGM